ncbi:hypothetical protein [Methanoplanus endosymbiosus]|uniref:Dockerin domain-containing protein n=1 Tax=Methanoplanus endosymbiosus TaxID=33865 RepID=A0A9E7PPG2_9EURY|nr:hypothetical protein [Methanoplanus endosymbiosus]UUX93062.1 hypothetical protein L6E24_02780 [Methanoplanus endosymbiosus]
MTNLRPEWKSVIFAVLLLLFIFSVNPASAAGTDQVTVKKIAADGTSVIKEMTVDVDYMENNLDVQGDGTTHYYMQGPVFEDGEDGWTGVHPGEPYNMWNPREDVNSYPIKDMGNVKGTDTKDLCDLVGGASEGDEIVFVASDGYSKKVGYDNVYSPESRQGKIVLAWWKNGSYSGDGYTDGMKNIFFADTSVNEWGEHIFGNQDMNATLDEKYWHYFDGKPATTGLGVKNINTIKILTDEPAPTTDVIFDGSVALGEGTVAIESVEGNSYDVNELTPLGALFTVASEESISVNVTDKKFETMGILLLNDINEYLYVKGGDSWVCYLNGNLLDDYSNPATEGLNTCPLSVGDELLFLYGGDGVTEATATAKVAITVTSGSSCDTIFDGSVALGEGTVAIESVEGNSYDVNELTPLGALFTVASEESISVNVTDKKFETMGILLLNDINEYLYVKGGDSWVCYLNGNLLDDYSNPATEGLNTCPLSVGDELLFLYGGDDVTEETAVAKVAITVTSGSSCDTLFDGTVTLGEGTVSVESIEGTSYDVNELTPLGALQTVASEESLAVNVTDKSYDDKGILLLNDINEYFFVKHESSWICSVNGKVLDDWGNYATEGFNIYPLSDGDKVLFLYGGDDVTEETAVAKVAIEVSSGEPSVWDLSLAGKSNVTLTKSQFEAKVVSHGEAEFTDDNGLWGGLPLYKIVGIVDDNDPETFNTALAAEGYSIKVTSEDGYSINFESADISECDGYIMANSLNSTDLPQTIGEKEKPCYPLRMVGDDVGAGQLIGAIVSVELIGLPEPVEGWSISVNGVISDKISQAEFEEGSCHRETYTDPDGNEWSGVPLWVIVAVSDNIESTNHWTFSDAAAAEGYTVKIIASDGFSREFASADIARNDSYILADECNGEPLPDTGDDSAYPVRLVGSPLWSEEKGGFSGSAIGQVATIDLVGLIPQPPVAGSWNLTCEGKIGAVITQTYFEQGLACHHESTWTDADENVWSGVPLYDFCGWVDDRVPHGSSGFNRGLAEAGYTVIITASDGYSKELDSSLILESKDNYSVKIIVANKCNGQALELPPDGSWPLRVVGPGLPSASYSIGQLAKIKLTDFEEPTDIPKLTIVKYGADHVTEVANVSVDYTDLIEQFAVHGDGETLYKFEGLCFPPADPWDQNETYPGGFKITEPMKGTSIKDICSLAGGMNEGTEITFIAKDGWTSKLSYDVIYNDPSEVPALGTPVLAWYGYTGDGNEKGAMPYYEDGFRVFFDTEDHIFGQYDMFETIPANYWHYNSGLPSCAGLSAKYLNRIEIQTVPDPTWNLELDGAINATISKGYFEAALGCTMAQGEESHKVEFTDNSGDEWSGMPLWLLCGFVDDDNPHTGKSYNETLAAEGYNIVITDSDGNSVTIDSRLTIKSSNYIIANEMNNQLIDPADGNWPLKLTGENITETDSIGNITEIELVFEDMPEIIIPDACIYNNGTVTIPVSVRDLVNASGVGVRIKWNPEIADVESVTFNSTVFSGSSFYANLTDGIVFVSVTNEDGMTSEDESPIFDLNVRASLFKAGYSCLFEVVSAEWSDQSFLNNKMYGMDGTFKIRQRGDFNRNGYVDIGDVSNVAYMIAGKATVIYPEADFNDNGEVDTGDAAKIAWYYIGKLEYL